MLNKIRIEVFDNRRCVLGEGPTSFGQDNNNVMWVDILEGEVLSRNIESGNIANYKTGEDVSFAIPRKLGGQILGTQSGPVLKNLDGSISKLPVSDEVKNIINLKTSRWNDAKVAPDGSLWLGTMTYIGEPNKSALYRYSHAQNNLKKILSDVTVSNGMDWSSDNKKFYFIDSGKRSIDCFDLVADGSEITNRKVMWEVRDKRFGIPDGMTIDVEDGLWVAFWGGSTVRRFDKNFTVTHEIVLPAVNPTSCVFAGPNLDTLIVTTAHNRDVNSTKEDGLTFICKPGFAGKPTKLFPF